MKTAKKVLSILSLTTMGLAVLMLIWSIFGDIDKILTGIGSSFLLTFSAIAICSAFLITSLNYFNRNKALSITSLTLNSVLMVLFIIAAWVGIKSLFGKFILVLAITTIFFNIMVSTGIKLSKRYKGLQITNYILIIAIDVSLILTIFGWNVIKLMGWQIFTLLCLCAFGTLLALGILARKNTVVDAETNVNNGEYITIKKKEYNALLLKIKSLEAEIAVLKDNRES